MNKLSMLETRNSNYDPSEIPDSSLPAFSISIQKVSKNKLLTSQEYIAGRFKSGGGLAKKVSYTF